MTRVQPDHRDWEVIVFDVGGTLTRQRTAPTNPTVKDLRPEVIDWMVDQHLDADIVVWSGLAPTPIVDLLPVPVDAVFTKADLPELLDFVGKRIVVFVDDQQMPRQIEWIHALDLVAHMRAQETKR